MNTCREEISNLERAIEFAPKQGTALQTGLVGFVSPNQTCVCAGCSARIFARGCDLPRGSEPVWSPAKMHCCLCFQDK